METPEGIDLSVELAGIPVKNPILAGLRAFMGAGKGEHAERRSRFGNA